MNRQDEPATEAQKSALLNKAVAFGLNYNEPETKGEASAEFKRLEALIFNILCAGTIDEDPEADDDWLGPIY